MIVNGLKEYESIKSNDSLNNTKNKPIDSGSKTVNNEKSLLYVGSSITSENLNLLTYDDKSQKVEDNTTLEVDVDAKEKLLQQANTMSSRDMEDLSKEDKAIEEYTVDELELAIIRVKEQRASYQEHIKAQVIKLEEKVEQIKDIGKNGSNDAKKYIIEKLEKAGLPITDDNISRMADILQMSNLIGEMSDKTYRYMIQNNLDVNIHNIYKASFGGSNVSYPPVSKEILKELENNINSVIEDALMPVNEESKRLAVWLLDNQLPLTSKNLWQLKDLTDLKMSFDKEEVMDTILNGVKKGQAMDQVYLGMSVDERSKNLLDILSNLEHADESIEHIVSRRNKVSIKSLYEYEKNKKAKTESNLDELSRKEINKKELDSIHIESITNRRQLEEIRLKLTVESGAKLIKNGISIEVVELSKLVDELKGLEQEYYRNLLKENGVRDNNDAVDRMKDSLHIVSELRSVPSFILGKTLFNKREETINSLALSGEKLKNDLVKANLSYEPLMTTPRKDMGDSIQKAFSNIDAILEDMDLPVTNDNKRAVRILGYNNIEITNENINNVKAYDSEVNYMLNHLKPSVTAAFIKKGINPLDIPIHELNQQIDSIRDEIGISEDEKYSKFLYKLEKNNEITMDEKQSFIGIYRLLNHLDKSDGSALGYVLNTKKEVNLKNLLSGIRTLQGGGITADIDDSFGTLKEINYRGKRITDQINAAFHSEEDSYKVRDDYTHLKHTISNLKEEITPDILKELSQSDDLYQMPFEVFYDKVYNNEGMDKNDTLYYEEKRVEYAQLMKDSTNEIKLLSDSNLAVTIHNIYNISDFFSSKHSIFHRMEEKFQEMNDREQDRFMKDMDYISMELLDSFTNKEELSSSLEIASEKLISHLNKLYENTNLTSKELKELQRINNGFVFMKDMAKRECYEIPLVVDNEITNVNLTLIHNSKEQGKVNIKLNTPHLGDINMNLLVKQGDVRGLVTVDNKAGYEDIKNSLKELLTSFEGIGITSSNIAVVMEKGKKSMNLYDLSTPNDKGQNIVSEGEGNDEASQATKTDTLYDLAKTVLIFLKRVDSSSIKG